MRLRRLVAPVQIETTPHGYRLVPEHVEVDAERFERLVERGIGKDAARWLEKHFLQPVK